MSDADPMAKALSAGLCESFSIDRLNDDRVGDAMWVVHTPFLYDDGDALPVFIAVSQGLWSLTDNGMTTSHLFFDEFEATDSRMERIKSVVVAGGGTYDSDRVVRLELQGEPSPYDVGDFIQLMAQLRGAAMATSTEREQTRYVTRVRTRVVDALQTPDWQANWSPPDDPSRLFKADLRVATSPDKRPVALFLASTAAKTSDAALSANHFAKLHADVQPLLAYDPGRVPSKAVHRFQETVEDDLAAVPTPPDDITRILPELRRRGVLV